MHKLLTFPSSQTNTLSIRAKAFVFNDPASVNILRTTEKIAPTSATVLIVGDTGTGKELIARHLHERSGRHGPFVAVNCGAFSESLIEAELFGHEAGAFTGAQGQRQGWFEAAHYGTLFLDEIGDLPLGMQVKLLRVLQEREVVRLGSRKPIDTDVRLIAATNVDLVNAVEAGHFRADLYYRLNIAPITLPPLCERPGDIWPLVEHFVEHYRTKLHLESVACSPEAQQALLEYPWPGNIRELENVIHYALIVCSDGILRVRDLRLNSRVPVLPSAAPRSGPGASDLETVIGEVCASRAGSVAEYVEEVMIRQAFEHCKHNQVHTARLLGLTRNVLRAQLKRFNLLAESA